MIKKISKLLNIDFDIGNTLLLRLWSLGAGGILVLMIPAFLSASEQGYYFTFSSLIGLQIFFELGFNFVVMQMISHEMVNVQVKNDRLCGDEYSIKRIYSLISLLVRWYRIISILFFVIVLVIGYHFFQKNGVLPIYNWLFAWLLIVLFSAINIFVSPFLAVLEGMGFIGRVARMRLCQSILGYLLLSILFLFNFKLNAIPAISGVAALFSIIYLFKRYSKILFRPESKINISDSNVKISWRHEIFPFQWRIAVSWLSGYFIFQLFNPLIFTHQGAIEAGKIGLTLTIFSTILSLSISWVTAKIPLISQYVSKGDKKNANPLFKELLIRSTIINLAGSLFFVGLVFLFKHYGLSITSRLTDIKTLLLMVGVNLINHIVFCCAAYMRAHKKEPMLYNSVVTGIVVAIVVYFSSMISVYVTIFSYFTTLLLICLPWTIFLFRKYYNGITC